MPTRPARLASGQYKGRIAQIDYQILLQLLQGVLLRAVRPGSAVELSQDLEEDWPGRLVARDTGLQYGRHRVTTIVRKRVSTSTFQSSGVAKTPGGQLQTRWDRLTLPVVYPVGYNGRDVDLRSRLWLLCRRVLLQVHPLAPSLARN